ncbi:tail protein X [Sporosarcina sp. P33]|uniref:tail protein X n=1 Tax=Sporosarcina sp. P33 TaxID=1930764 RepID=UPI0009BDF9C1|nr:tail protein X [Sporosarcina sp. P33]ARD47571.1 hypothetical protein SporoP33_04510 [Sporosarcina sp. P33]
MKIYSTIQGDSWDLICYKNYGTELVMHKVMDANPHLTDIAIFGAGTLIKLPELDPTEELQDLPPWVIP